MSAVERLSSPVKVVFSASDKAWLEKTAQEGKFASVPALIRSIIRTVREDDESAHEDGPSAPGVNEGGPQIYG